MREQSADRMDVDAGGAAASSAGGAGGGAAGGDGTEFPAEQIESLTAMGFSREQVIFDTAMLSRFTQRAKGSLFREGLSRHCTCGTQAFPLREYPCCDLSPVPTTRDVYGVTFVQVYLAHAGWRFLMSEVALYG